MAPGYEKSYIDRTAAWLLSFIKEVPTVFMSSTTNLNWNSNFSTFKQQNAPTIPVLYFSSRVSENHSVLCPASPNPDQEKCLFYLEERTLAVVTAAALEKSAGAPGLLQPSPLYFFPVLHRRHHPALQSQENRLLQKLRVYHARPRRNILRRPLLGSLSFSVLDLLWFQFNTNPGPVLSQCGSGTQILVQGVAVTL